MRTLTGFLAALSLAAVARAGAADTPLVTLSVTPIKSDWVIGEPIDLAVVISNRSNAVVVYHSIQPYAVTVIGPLGQTLRDPNQNTMYSGIFPDTKIGSGESKEFQADLNAFCTPTTPGTYRVRFGINEDSQRAWPGYPPACEFSVHLRIPTPEEAAAVVANLAHRRYGFNALRLPVYAEPLRHYGAGKGWAVFSALSLIPTREATKDLVDFLGEETDARSLDSDCSYFEVRLPWPGEQVAPQNSPLEGVLIDPLWDDSTRSRAREVARGLLARPEPFLKLHGAQILGPLGTEADFTALAALARQALENDSGEAAAPWEMHERLMVGSFALPLNTLIRRGVAPPRDSKADPLWTYLALSASGRSGASRPAGWSDLVRLGFASPYPALRQAAIGSIPHPPPAEFADMLGRAKEDPSERVRRVALFVSEHKIVLEQGGPFSPKLPPTILQVDTGKMTPDSAQWQVDAYSADLARNPKDADAYDNRGIAKYVQKHFDAAIADFDAALLLRPRLGAAYNNRGLARAAKGESEGAITDYSQALSLDAKMEEAYFNRGFSYAAAKRYDEALRDFNAVIALNLESAAAFGQRALLERGQGKIESADADEKHADALDPKWREVHGRPRIQAGG